MAKVVVDNVAELKKELAGEKVIFGSEVTLKNLREGKLAKVFVASNCNANVKSDIVQLCNANGVELVELSQTNEEIGVLSRKPFSVSVVGVLV